ncbi:MAG: amino acid adenylation domain-containing protein [Acidobacteria bacterium]|nr:amino acid adenylation domain-containing protein [Acidobacteriota bacterium]
MNERKTFPLSHPQKRVWLTEQTFLATPYFNLAFRVRLPYEARQPVLEQAVNLLLRKNDGLRLRILEDTPGRPGEPCQYVADFEPFTLRELTFSEDDAETGVAGWLERETRKVFDLIDRPLYDFALVHTPGRSSLFLKVHHLVSDGGTIFLMVNDINAFYNALSRGQDVDPTPRPSYLEFIGQEQEYLRSEAAEADRRFWIDKLSPLPELIDLSSRKKGRGGIEAERTWVAFPDGLRNDLHAFAEQNRSSVFKLVISAFAVYLSRFGRTPDVVIGSVNHNRTTPRTREMIGMFVSTFNLRLNVDPSMDFRTFVLATGREVDDIVKNHQRYPYDLLVPELREIHQRPAEPLAQISVIGHGGTYDAFRPEYQDTGCEPVPINVHIDPNGKDTVGTLELSIDYHPDLFEPADIENLFSCVCAFLENGLANPLARLSDIPLTSGDELRRVLREFNDTAADFPTGETLHGLFETQAARVPDRKALVFDGRPMTYRHLDASSNRLARLLVEKGLRREEIVGVLADRSLEVVVALLAVLKAGGAYLPIDPHYPAERARFLLEDAGCRFLLAHPHLGADLGFSGERIALAPPAETVTDAASPGVRVEPSQLAYVIYTSGSTGRPKGVMIEHRAAVNLVQWHRRHYGIDETDVCAEFASFSFDASVSQTFSPLASGAELHVLDEGLRASAEQVNAYFEANGVTYTDLPTQLFEYFMEAVRNTSLKRLTTGGEKLRKFIPQNYKVYDEYGPTEFTVVSTSFLLDRPYDRSPIGRPVANARAYVLDPAGRPQPVGLPGELCLAGANLARGYLNREELTREKFVPDPFVPGERMYRTGDLVRWLPDGNLDYLGRIDFQVKIRGFRIEMPEIEEHLRGHKAVKEAVVVDRTDAGGAPYLCAYFVSSRDIPVSELKAFLGRTLPDYMVPAIFMRLEKMPLNTSGKVDRRALPEPAASAETRRTAYVAPTSEAQLAIAALFEELLGCPRVGLNDSFFELGGHSLKAAILQARLLKRFGVRLSLQDLFDGPTVKALDERVSASRATDAVPVIRVPDAEHYPLSPVQSRLYFLHLLNRDAVTYNVSLLLRIEGNLDTGKLCRAFDAFVAKHDVLRTAFALRDGAPVQVVHPRVRLKAHLKEAPEEAVGDLMDAFVRPFDLSRPPLMRVNLVRSGERLHFLMLDFHHIVFDGMSVEVLLRDLADFYLGERMEPLAFRYRDVADWQRRFLAGEGFARLERFWLDLFRGDVPVLDLMTDFPRPKDRDHRGRRHVFSAGPALTEGLRGISRKIGCTLYMTLLSAFGVLLARFTSQDDLVVGTPSLGRTLPEAAPVAGMFVNSLPLRLHPSPDKTFEALLAEVRQLLPAAMDNQDYPLDTLVEKLGIERNSGRNPLFDVMFTFASRFDDTLRFVDLTLSKVPRESGVSKFDLTLDSVERPAGIDFEIEYATDLFRPETVERLAAHFLNILAAVGVDPGIAIRDIDSLPAAERGFLLETYNATASDYPADRTLHALFEAQAARTPERAALVCEGTAMTYGGLNAAANRLARVLRAKGAGPGHFVGILMHRRPELVVAILGTLKAGAAYVPIDPSYPADRIAYIAGDAGMTLLLTEAALAGRIEGTAEQLVWERLDLANENPDNPSPAAGPGDLVYMIYTSGSTGKPKGVMLRHRNVVNYVTWAQRAYLEGEALDFSLHSSISFDLTVTSVFTPLLSGNTLVIYPDTGDNIALIRRIVAEDRTGIVKLTPSHLRILSELDIPNRNLKKFIVGGEELPSDLCRKLTARFDHPVTVFNEYGPTEAAVGCMIHRFDPERDRGAAVPIGVPCANAAIYLLDDDLHPVPFGAKGEIFIGGEGVAAGYRNRPEMTAGRFLPSPFRDGDTLYRTGDLARFLMDGTLEYLGRADTQVKIRGFRIECGEIEQKLLAHPDIRSVVVTLRRDDQPEAYLCAYFEAERDLFPAELREFLAGALPEYMVPSFFIRLERIPVNENGKVDRKALPPPSERLATGAAYVAPRNPREQRILEIWREVLRLDRIGVRDNFFHAGGHSLKAIALVARLQKHFKADLNDVYRYQTVEEQAEHLPEETDVLRRRLEKLREAPPPTVDAVTLPAVREGIGRYEREVEALSGLDLSGRKAYRHVLLTGATGFLGAHLLQDLLARPDVGAVTAVVRAEDDAGAAERLRRKLAYYFGSDALPGADKLRVQSGDLARERLGMGPAAYTDLAAAVDCIVNSAAVVKHYGKLEDFRSANVHSVRNLADFARDGAPKDFHHVSTLSVGLGDVAGEAALLFTEDVCDAGQKTGNPYLVTKLEAERLLLEARAQGLTANIYRVGNIVYHSGTGVPQENLEDNVFYALVKSAARLGAVMEGEVFDFSFVDQVSRAILTLFDRPALANRTFHVENPLRADLAAVLRDPEVGLNVRVMTRPDFIAWLSRNFTRPAFRDQIELFMLHMDWLSDRDGPVTETVRLSGKTRALLDRLGFAWTPVDPAKMRPMLRHAVADVAAFLSGTPLFGGADADLLFRAACAGRREYYDRDDVLLWEGDANPDLFLVEKGYLEVFKHSREGWLGTLFVAGENAFLGENALWGEPTSVIAEPVFDGTLVLRLDGSWLQRLLSDHPGLALRFMKELGKRLENLQRFVVSMG